MDREEILSRNKEDNAFQDECERQNKWKGQSFALLGSTVVCLVVLIIKTICHQEVFDVVAILLTAPGCVLAHRACKESDRASAVAAVFCFAAMAYYFVKFLMAV